MFKSIKHVSSTNNRKTVQESNSLMHDGSSDCTSSEFIQVFNSNGHLNRGGFLLHGDVCTDERGKNLPDEDVSTTSLVPL